MDDLIGTWSQQRLVEYFTDIEDLDEAKRFVSTGASGQHSLLSKRPYQHTGMVLGFIAQGAGPAILSASDIKVDKSLIGSSIKITLDRFHVHCYPGWGEHSILCEFTGKNQASSKAEELAFAFRFEARDRSAPSISGAPIFLGLNVGSDGVSFKGRSVNVQSSADELILKVLDTPAFKSGLTLLNTAQPALKPLTSLATALVDASAKRRRNAPVHKFELGLDFDGSPTSARLGLGSYIVVQTDDFAGWDWSQYEWSQQSSALQLRGKPAAPIEFNYMVFGVSLSTAAQAKPSGKRS